MAQVLHKVRERLVVLSRLQQEDLELGLEMAVLQQELCMITCRIPLAEVPQVLQIQRRGHDRMKETNTNKAQGL
jgi:hypothetical protein